MNLKIKYAVLILLLGFLSIEASTDAAQEFQKGEITGKVVCVNDASQSYSLFLPTEYNKNEKWPVLFAFEPAARSTLPLKLFKEAAEKYNYIVVCSANVRNGPRDPIVKGMASVWVDVSTRFSIDKKRIYATGFSGGSRVSSFFHFVIRNPVKGIIGVGAGLSAGLQPNQVQTTHYFGIAGYGDFNYVEMVRLEKTLQRMNTFHRFYYYNYRHRWPPKELCTRALEWMELMALKTGIIAIEKRIDFIDEIYEKESKLAAQRQQAGEFYYAAGDYRALARVFKGLKPIEPFTRAYTQIEASKAYKKFNTRELKRIQEEKDYISRCAGIFNHIKKGNPKSVRLAKLLQFVGVQKLKSQLAKKKNPHVSSMADRVLYNLANQSRLESNNAVSKGDIPRAALFLEVGINMGKHTFFYPNLCYNLGALNARMGQSKKAIKMLKLAVKSGYKNADYLQNDEDFQSIRNSKGFRELLKTMRTD